MTAANMYRCYHCQPNTEFEAAPGAAPICPKCQAGEDAESRAMFIAQLSFIHFDPPTKFKGLHKHHRACDPSRYSGGGGLHLSTGNPNCVTCAACKQTEAWKTAAEAWGPDTLSQQVEEPAA